MSYEFSILSWIRFISGFFAIGLILLLWSRRHSPGAWYLMLFEIAAAVWAISDGFEAAGTTVTVKLFWSQIAYIGVTTSGVMFLMFTLSFTNHSSLVNRRTLSLLMIIPVLTFVMALTNPVHHLLWKKIEVIGDTHMSIYSYGPYFWVHVIFEYAALALGIFILIDGALKVYSLHKVQLWVLILSTLLPVLSSVSYVFKFFPVKGFDPTPVSFILTGILITGSFYWLRLFNIIPIARRQALDNLRDGILVADSGNRIVDVNPAFAKILGKTTRQMIGSDAGSVLSELNVDIGKFSEENEFTIETKIGAIDPQYFEVGCHLVRSNNIEVAGKIYMVSEVTTKRMILDSIAESSRQRKKELAEKEKLILDLDAYARTVAHDLKNPLGVVINATELIKKGLSANNTTEALEMAALVQGQGEKMVRIIDDLLMLSRIRKEDIRVVPLDNGPVLTEALKRLKNDINTSGATFEIAPAWPIVLGHEQWIEEVWVNLISNAIKFGGTSPVIKIGFEKSPESFIRFWIHDNGKGLPDDSLQKIFMDFERLGRKDVHGHGLGLSIVKRIIEKLGGVVKVESSNIPGEGCIFSFTLKDAQKNQFP